MHVRTQPVALARFAHRISDRFEERRGRAGTVEEARRAMVDLITPDVLTDPRVLALTHELYTPAARDPGYRELTHAWRARSRRALDTAPHDATEVDATEVVVAVERITAATGGHGSGPS